MTMYLQDRAKELIAQGALTNSKRPETFVEGVYPTHLHRGEGCYVWDCEGKKYFDFITGLGCNLLGYAQEDVDRAIMQRLKLGATLSLGTQEELTLAQKIKTLFPFIDCMRFLKTGSEACSAALRIARAFTGKDMIYSNGYHGWHDEFISMTPPALGVPRLHGARPIMDASDERILHVLQNDTSWKNDGEGILAAIIIEPVGTDYSLDRIAWLKELRRLCTKRGVLLIFDEVITGFRFQNYAVSKTLEVEPDLIILGKAIANGMPLSVVGGKKAVMNCAEYFVSSTFAGETLSLVAASKTLELLRTPKYNLSDLWQKGEKWLGLFNSLWPEKIRIEGYPTRGRFVGDPVVKALFFQESIDSGMLFGPSWFFNFPLAEKSEITLSAVKDIICKIKSGRVHLRGKMPRSPFAETVRHRQA